jgi:hypothetical protein
LNAVDTLLEKWEKADLVPKNDRDARAFATYIVKGSRAAETVKPGITRILKKNDYLDKNKKIIVTDDDTKHSGTWIILSVLMLKGMIQSRSSESNA